MTKQKENQLTLVRLLMGGLDGVQLSDIPSETLIHSATNLALKASGHGGVKPLISTLLEEMERRDLSEAGAGVLLASVVKLITADRDGDKLEGEKSLAELSVRSVAPVGQVKLKRY